MSQPLILKSTDDHDIERAIGAVAQHLCCPEGCKRGGVRCLSADFRQRAILAIKTAGVEDNRTTQ